MFRECYAHDEERSVKRSYGLGVRDVHRVGGADTEHYGSSIEALAPPRLPA